MDLENIELYDKVQLVWPGNENEPRIPGVKYINHMDVGYHSNYDNTCLIITNIIVSTQIITTVLTCVIDNKLDYLVVSNKISNIRYMPSGIKKDGKGYTEDSMQMDQSVNVELLVNVDKMNTNCILPLTTSKNITLFNDILMSKIVMSCRSRLSEINPRILQLMFKRVALVCGDRLNMSARDKICVNFLDQLLTRELPSEDDIKTYYEESICYEVADDTKEKMTNAVIDEFGTNIDVDVYIMLLDVFKEDLCDDIVPSGPELRKAYEENNTNAK